MATYYLLNSVSFNGGPQQGQYAFHAGQLIDDQKDPATTIRAVGGALWPTADAIVAAAATRARLMKANGANDEALFEVMAVAADLSNSSQPAAAWVVQTEWRIDPVSGNDSAVGNAAAPLQTFTEYVRRMVLPINVAQTVTIASDLISSDVPEQTVRIGPLGSVRFPGVPVTLHSGTITSRITCVPSTRTPDQITDAALATSNAWSAWTTTDNTALGIRVRVTAGAHPGAVVWVAKDLGAKSARVSAPVVADRNIGVFSQVLVTLEPGDSYVVERLPKINSCYLVFRCDRSNGGFANGPSRVIFDGLFFGGAANIASSSSSTNRNDGNVTFVGCDVGNTTFTGATAFIGCRFSGFECPPAEVFILTGLSMYGFVSFPAHAQAMVAYRFMVQGSGLFTSQSSPYGTGIGSVQVYDSPSSGVGCFGGTPTFALPFGFGPVEVFGSGNAGYGLKVVAGVVASRDPAGTYSITGTLGDVRVGTTTRTWAQIPYVESDVASGSGTKLAGLVTSTAAPP